MYILSFQAHRRGGHFEPYPSARRRQWPHIAPGSCPVSAPSDYISPSIGPMFPTLGVFSPLQHYLLRGVLRIEIYVGIEFSTVSDREPWRRPQEILLMEAGDYARLMRHVSRIRGRTPRGIGNI